MRRAALLLLACCAASAQPTVAPSGEPASALRGENVSGYNIVNSFETGYRFRSVRGDLGKYRSDVNFGNGVRLLSSTFSMHSREGQGRFFDELLLNTQGLGNDPYQFSSFRIQKNRLYRYDLLWRQNDYYNPALSIAGGQHRIDTSRRLQDHDLVLLPQSAFRLFAGYSRNVQEGPALSTVNLQIAEFPLFSDIRRTQDEYRAGTELRIAGVKLSLTRAWEFFRDDTRETQSAIPNLNSFRRDQPMHGSVNHWRIFLLADRSRRWGLSGRFAYAGGRQDFIFDEASEATLRPGSTAIRQTLIFGNARRPVVASNLTATLRPTDKLTLVNHTSFHHTRMDGDATYRELAGPGAGFESLDFQFLGIRLFSNTATLDYRPAARVGVYTGYHVAARRIRSVQDPGGPLNEQSNTLHSGMFGVRLRPAKPLQINLDAELGRANRPFYPVSEKDYHAFSGRLTYRTRTLQLSAAARTNYNFNSVALSNHSSRSRNYFADASWSGRPWLGLDASYAKLHVDTLTGIAYFATGTLINDRSFYESNIHSGTLGLRLNAGERFLVTLGYSKVQDTGAERRPAALPTFTTAQVYPLSFDSPFARVSIRLFPKLRWNAGYQHYRYREDLLPVQNYRAHTGFTSLTWSF